MARSRPSVAVSKEPFFEDDWVLQACPLLIVGDLVAVQACREPCIGRRRHMPPRGAEKVQEGYFLNSNSTESRCLPFCSLRNSVLSYSLVTRCETLGEHNGKRRVAWIPWKAIRGDRQVESKALAQSPFPRFSRSHIVRGAFTKNAVRGKGYPVPYC